MLPAPTAWKLLVLYVYSIGYQQQEALCTWTCLVMVTPTHNSVVESKPYGDDCIPRKLECIGHVQKRVGSRLLKLKSSKKAVKRSDGKGQRVFEWAYLVSLS